MEPLSDLAGHLLAELGHPVRLPILLALEERPRSATELARDLDQPFDRVNHALRALAAAGVVELIRHEPVADRTNLVRRVYASRYRGWNTLVAALEDIASSGDET
ncbi:MAG TPA: winged helix-turn-helix domain-containing protein [Baekduia sp.]|uniref:ArsR/SmtB family transcription factor n=1 Tax=Baekduia sp. TaxID=2600305 RepID=UPI002C425C95|nr:winged helix-turn-helix domain-containing protein [Baekduia sp.]HMJ36090.1 winged helix-turn-helix domain-containing protein [Baekduia sp.]